MHAHVDRRSAEALTSGSLNWTATLPPLSYARERGDSRGPSTRGERQAREVRGSQRRPGDDMAILGDGVVTLGDGMNATEMSRSLYRIMVATEMSRSLSHGRPFSVSVQSSPYHGRPFLPAHSAPLSVSVRSSPLLLRRALQIRERAMSHFRRVFAECDVLLTPMNPIPAPRRPPNADWFGSSNLGETGTLMR